MKIVVVDDEPSVLLAMRRLLAKVEGVELAGSFRDAAGALAFVRNNSVELAFLDIAIGEDNGLELARSLRALCPDLDIVFTTSHSEYAMPAYDVYPLDYMLKPVSAKRLEQTIARAFGSREAVLSSTSAQSSPLLTVRGLGCFEACSPQAGAVKWISKKSAELFAYLLVHRRQSSAKSRILEDVFPNMPTKNAEIYLHTAVYQLRKVLAQHGLQNIIHSSQEQYRIAIAQIDVDFIQFEQDTAAWSKSAAADEELGLELEKRFTGALFEDKSYVWATAARERLLLAYDTFAKSLVNRLLIREQYQNAAAIAGRLVERNEFDEEANLLLMNVFGLIGNLSALHSAYERYAKLLLQELGVMPSTKIRLVYERFWQAGNSHPQ